MFQFLFFLSDMIYREKLMVLRSLENKSQVPFISDKNKPKVSSFSWIQPDITSNYLKNYISFLLMKYLLMKTFLNLILNKMFSKMKFSLMPNQMEKLKVLTHRVKITWWISKKITSIIYNQNVLEDVTEESRFRNKILTSMTNLMRNLIIIKKSKLKLEIKNK